MNERSDEGDQNGGLQEQGYLNRSVVGGGGGSGGSGEVAAGSTANGYLTDSQQPPRTATAPAPALAAQALAAAALQASMPGSQAALYATLLWHRIQQLQLHQHPLPVRAADHQMAAMPGDMPVNAAGDAGSQKTTHRSVTRLHWTKEEDENVIRLVGLHGGGLHGTR
jgi:hypothetical protein